MMRDDLVLKRGIRLRVGAIERRPEDGDRPAAGTYRRPVRDRVNAVGEAAHHHDALLDERAAEDLGAIASRRRRPARPDHRNARDGLQEPPIADEVEPRRGVLAFDLVERAEKLHRRRFFDAHSRGGLELTPRGHGVELIESLSVGPTNRAGSVVDPIRSAIAASEDGGRRPRCGRLPPVAEDDDWIGIDFSGDPSMWGPARARSNVWISRIRRVRGVLKIADLRHVRELRGRNHPFLRLARFLRMGRYRAAAIDAPFSVPAQFMRLFGGSHDRLLACMREKTPHPPRHFITARRFVKLVAGTRPPLDPPKPLRRTELHWKQLCLNVRSTMWAGARGGSAMTAACLRLLAIAGRPVWPWEPASRLGLLVEAYPAAQLRYWGLPSGGYDHGAGDPARARIRAMIVEALGRRIEMGRFEEAMRENADALDAVVCAFAGLAVTADELGVPVEPQAARTEGWIAVCRRIPPAAIGG